MKQLLEFLQKKKIEIPAISIIKYDGQVYDYVSTHTLNEYDILTFKDMEFLHYYIAIISKYPAEQDPDDDEVFNIYPSVLIAVEKSGEATVSIPMRGFRGIKGKAFAAQITKIAKLYEIDLCAVKLCPTTEYKNKGALRISLYKGDNEKYGELDENLKAFVTEIINILKTYR